MAAEAATASPVMPSVASEPTAPVAPTTQARARRSNLTILVEHTHEMSKKHKADATANSSDTLVVSAALAVATTHPSQVPYGPEPIPAHLEHTFRVDDFARLYQAVTLQKDKTHPTTLFGKAMLCVDRRAALQASSEAAVAVQAHNVIDRVRAHSACLVMVKQSFFEKIERVKKVGCTEDVAAAARVLRWLGAERPLLEAEAVSAKSHLAINVEHLDPSTWGLSSAFGRKHGWTAGGALGDNRPAGMAMLQELAEGARFIVSLHDEFVSVQQRSANQGPRYHYMTTGYCARGDLFDLLVGRRPHHRFTEAECRPIFAQIVRGVRWMHARSVAHLDLSVENICLDANGDVKIIDMGMSIVHPRCAAAPLGGQDAHTLRAHNHLQLATEPVVTNDANRCFCEACCSAPSQLQARASRQVDMCVERMAAATTRPLQSPMSASALSSASSSSSASASLASFAKVTTPDGMAMMMDVDSDNATEPQLVVSPVIATASPPSVSNTPDDLRAALSQRCNFLMRPICTNLPRPGKITGQSPELSDHLRSIKMYGPWDAYASDCFALGTILWMMLRGRMPFEKAGDVYYRSFLSGKWLRQWPVWLAADPDLPNLSPQALDLIDQCFKPQHMRPTVDEILQHPWLEGGTAPL